MRLKDYYVEVNYNRIDYLLNLFRLNKAKLTQLINENNPRKNPFKEEEIFSENKQIKISLLKKMDKIFQKGLSFYLDKTDLPEGKRLSIFFRKNNFNSDLNLETLRVVNRKEEEKFRIQSLCEDINYKLERNIKTYSTTDSAQDTANEIRKKFSIVNNNLYAKKHNDRNFLKNLIEAVEDFNIFVLEHTEHYSKKEKVSFCGLFLNPNIIVINKQKHVKREIFTLLHEFAHFLLNKEEIDQMENVNAENEDYEIEKWCNDFAYYFLISEYATKIETIEKATSKNNFHEELFNKISSDNHISTFSLYTKLKIINKISSEDYIYIENKIMKHVEKEELLKKEKFAKQKILNDMAGKPTIISPPQQIISNNLKNIVRENYFEGKIDNIEVCRILNIKSNKMEEVLYNV